MLLKDIILSANTGLDAIKRAPIIDYKTGLKCLRIQDVSHSKYINEWGNTFVNENIKQKFLLKKGDILIARTGSTIGINTYIPYNVNSVYNNGLICLKINKDIAIPYFIYLIFQTSHYKSFVKSISGSSATQPNMRIPDLLDLKIPDYSYTLQQHIVDTI